MKKNYNFKGFIDTTLRDGQASPLLYETSKYHFSLEEEKKIISSLLKLGVRYFEFFSPVVNEQERRNFSAIKKYFKPGKNIYFLAHCRCRLLDINASLKAGFNGLNLYMGVSNTAQEIYGKSLPQLIDLLKRTVISIRKKNSSIWLRYSVEDAFRTPLKDIFLVYDQVAKYVNAFGMPDTTGSALPNEVERRVRAFKKRYPKISLECHFHNDRGMSLINAITAVKNGAEFIDSSIWGMAERSGITSITAALLNLYETDKNLVKDFNIHLSYSLNSLMASILGLKIPWTEPVSPINRTHIAGVHQNGVLKNGSYEAHQLDKFGITKKNLFFGPLNGWNFIYYFLKKEGYAITPKKAKMITFEFKNQIIKMSRKKNPEKIIKNLAKVYCLKKR